MVENNLEEIEARIARATPGPWRIKPNDGKNIHRGTVQVEENGRAIETIAECYCGAYEGHGLRNAELIANAPEDLASLIEEIRFLREELAEEKRLSGMGSEREARLISERDEARKELVRLLSKAPLSP